MKHRASSTAIFATAMRANHLRWCAPPVFADHYAMRMLPSFWRLVIGNRLLNRLVVHALLGVFKPIHTENILRLRYAEEQLDAAVDHGVGQYVILGAGFDTFALRRPDVVDRLRVFELDHPATQQAKRNRLRRLGMELPQNLVFAPVDFESDSLDAALTAAGFDAERPAFFSWLGVTYYLTVEAIRETLDGIAACAAPGSFLLLDYKLPTSSLAPCARAVADKLDTFVKRLGEPMASAFTELALHDELRRIGGLPLDSVPPQEQARRYLADREDVDPPASNFAFALYSLQSPHPHAL